MTYTFTVLSETSNIEYTNIQYYDPFLYCSCKAQQPYVLRIDSSGHITPICNDNDLSNQLNCLAVYNSTTIYCAGANGIIYKIVNGIAETYFNAIGSLFSMTLSSTTLYFGFVDQICTIDIPTQSIPNVILDISSDVLYGMQFYNNTLYVSTSTTLYTLVNNIIIRQFSTGTNVTGCSIDVYGDWYVSNQLTDSGFSLVNDNDTLTTITTNLSSTPYISNIAFDSEDNAYYLKLFTTGIFKSSPAFCFNKSTKILCMNKQLVDQYIRVELLKVGDFVKTYKHGYRKVNQVITGRLRNNVKKWNMCMYKMAKTPINGLIEDLIVTGGHSLLVDAITDEEQLKYDEMGLTEFSKITIDNKRLLLSSVSNQFTPMQDREIYTYYHLLLENNDDDEERFGIWANGILTETPNVKTVK